jgi:hypothetical protein
VNCTSLALLTREPSVNFLDLFNTVSYLLIKQKSLHWRYFKELEQPEVNIQASHAWLKKSNIHPETEGFIFAIQDRVINTRNYKKHI